MSAQFLPEEIRTEEELHQLLESGQLRKIAEYLKWARVNLAKLDPLRFSLFTKFKANLLRKNVTLTDNDLLNKSITEITEILKSALGIGNATTNEQTISKVEKSTTEEVVKGEEPTEEGAEPIEELPEDAFGKLPEPKEEEQIKQIVTADVSVIEEERREFRKAVLGEEYKCVIKKGSALQFKMNKKGTRVEITIPSSWDIEIEDALLLDLYDKRFGAGVFELPTDKKHIETKEEHIVDVKDEQAITEATTELSIPQVTNYDKVQEQLTTGEIAQEEQVIEKEVTTRTNRRTRSDSLVPIDEFVVSLVKNTNQDFYQMRSSIIRYIKKNGIPAEFEGLEGGDAKKASTIMLKILCNKVKEGVISIGELEGRLSKRQINKLQESC